MATAMLYAMLFADPPPRRIIPLLPPEPMPRDEAEKRLAEIMREAMASPVTRDGLRQKRDDND